MSTTPDRNTINLQWLIRLRWGQALGQAVVIVGVNALMDLTLPMATLLAIVAVELASNVALAVWAGRVTSVRQGVLAAVLAADVMLLTALLFFSGGAFNPFNFLYLVHMALAAVVLPALLTWSLVVLSAVSFGALFFTESLGPDAAAHVHHADQMQMHLKGMWVAYAVAAVFIVYFVQRITRALGARERELALARERTARSERLAALATLAAGAAHELSTPLSTIALIASELRGHVPGQPDAIDEDLALIQGQVARCRSILEQMSTEAGDSPGEAPRTMSPSELAAAVVAAVERPNPVDVVVDESGAEAVLRVPERATVRAIRGLVDNACDASPSAARVKLEVEHRGDEVAFVVSDGGSGMADDVLERAGEPFFTTKEPGKGMGLGLFLARATAEQLGGTLQITSRHGRGTRAVFTIPGATNDHIVGPAAAAEE
ncbi:MAG TPA: HAMP domain-containing histidine kinase [Polyangiaceae bacterium]|nr:HAMP domain-containing histidine kinase [Polyangiaceae bacterium]